MGGLGLVSLSDKLNVERHHAPPRDVTMMASPTNKQQHPETMEEVMRLEDMPQDAFSNILSFLHFEDLDELSFVSKNMFAAVSIMTTHFFAFKTRCSERYLSLRFSPEGLRRLMGRFHHLEVLHMSGLASVGDDLFAILNQSPATSSLRDVKLFDFAVRRRVPVLLDIPHLTSVKISGELTNWCDSLTSSNWLKCLTIRDRHLKDYDLEELLRCHPRLEHLTVELESASRLSSPMIKSESLESLTIKGCSGPLGFPDPCCPRLRCLDLRSTSHVVFSHESDEENKLDEFIQSFPSLENLTLDINVKSCAITSLTLKSVLLVNCFRMKSIELICPNLERLKTPINRFLQKIHIVSKRHVKEINASHNSHLEDLELEMPSLGYLNLGWCARLTEEGCRLHFDSISRVKIGGTFLPRRLFPASCEIVSPGDG